MPNPEVKTFSPFTWVKVAIAVRRLFLYRVETANSYYRTYRMTGDVPPASILSIEDIEGSEAVLLFTEAIKEEVRSSEAIDVYILCGSSRGNTIQGKILVGEVDNSRDTNTQDQTSDPIILRFNKITNSTFLASDITLHDRQIAVSDATGISVGSYLILYNNTSGKVMPCVVTDIAGSPTLLIDRPADFAFPAIGTTVDVTVTSMSQDGLSSEQTFGIRGPENPDAVDVALDINEIRLFCITDTVPVLNDFGDLPALINGILIRSRNGGYKNIANIKTNAEILGAFGSWEPYIGSNPGIGVNGFVAVLKINGQANHGVAKRLNKGDDIEIVFNEDLSDLILFEAVAIGHVVEP